MSQYESAQGLSFTFSGQTFELTTLSFNKRVNEIDVSSLKTPQGSYRRYRPAPLREGDELSVEFWSISLPQMTATGALAWSFDGSGSNAAITAGLPTVALCTQSQLQASAGELVRGSATFRITIS